VPYTNPNKPPFAAWLIAQRKAQRPVLKAEEVARRLREAGLQAEDSTYRTWESASDRRPAPETIAALERMFGSRAPGNAEPSGDLASAIMALVTECRRWREEDRDRIADLERIVAGMAAERLSSQGTEGPKAPLAPRAKAG
jgi:hypothetical protein